MPTRLSVGDCVLVRTSSNDEAKDNTPKSPKQGIGLIKYIGFIQGQNTMKQYVGIELLEKVENGHDGTINGYQYFIAQNGCGIHLSLTDIVCKLSVAEIMSKFKEVVSFFKEKVSQYISALNERDLYIEKLKTQHKSLKNINQSSNHIIYKPITPWSHGNGMETPDTYNGYMTNGIQTPSSFQSVDTMHLQKQRLANYDSNNTAHSEKTTPFNSQKHLSPILRMHNSDSYPNTSTSTNNTNATVNSTVGTVGSHRSTLPVINEPDTPMDTPIQNNDDYSDHGSESTYSSSRASISYSNHLCTDNETVNDTPYHSPVHNPKLPISSHVSNINIKQTQSYYQQTQYGSHPYQPSLNHIYSTHSNTTMIVNNNSKHSYQIKPQLTQSVSYGTILTHPQLGNNASASVSMTEPKPKENVPPLNTECMYTANMYQPILQYYSEKQLKLRNINSGIVFDDSKEVIHTHNQNKYRNTVQFESEKTESIEGGSVWTESTNNYTTDGNGDGYVVTAETQYSTSL